MVPVSTHPLTKVHQLRSPGNAVSCLYFWGVALMLLPQARGDLIFFLFLPVGVGTAPFDISVLTKEPARKVISVPLPQALHREIEALGSRAHCDVCTSPLASPIIFLKVYSPGYVFDSFKLFFICSTLFISSHMNQECGGLLLLMRSLSQGVFFHLVLVCNSFLSALCYLCLWFLSVADLLNELWLSWVWRVVLPQRPLSSLQRKLISAVTSEWLVLMSASVPHMNRREAMITCDLLALRSC